MFFISVLIAYAVSGRDMGAVWLGAYILDFVLIGVLRMYLSCKRQQETTDADTQEAYNVR